MGARIVPMSESNVERARRGFEAVLRGDLELLRELLDPDVTWHGSEGLTTDSCQCREDVLRFIAQAIERGAIGELVDVIAVGDDVVVLMRPQPSADGSPAPLRANITRFRGGRAVELVAFDSPAEALASAGLGS